MWTRVEALSVAVESLLALLREVGPDPSAGVVAMSVIGVRVLAVAERTSG
jgi:hypothetical protein